MSSKLRISIICIAASMAPTGACLVQTTSLTMTLFFTAGLPLYGIGAGLYAAHVLQDLRRHRVL